MIIFFLVVQFSILMICGAGVMVYPAIGIFLFVNGSTLGYNPIILGMLYGSCATDIVLALVMVRWRRSRRSSALSIAPF
jgi:hypothetical protein